MRRGLGLAAAGGFAAVLLAGCVSFGPGPRQPNLTGNDLPGTWVSGDGASITFAASGLVTATRFDFGKVIPASISACRVLSGTGTWQLHNPADDNPPSPAGSTACASRSIPTRPATATFSPGAKPTPEPTPVLGPAHGWYFTTENLLSTVT